MGSVEHRDIQVNESGSNPLREMMRAINNELHYIAQAVTNNFRNPIAIPAALHQSSVIWAPNQPFDLLSFDAYCVGGAVINAITDGGVGIPMTTAGPWVIAAATHTNILCTTPYRVDAGQDVAFGFSTPPTGEDMVVSINARRLG